ncbi:MAG: hypothetical protein RML40_01470 [Bacteroidota bacterium]|nr:hypothetical protein [Candidatus Kapabacteria bacterium]MDW8219177.1 hypothetical protein [Bacteroidota bacterium]
MNQEVHMYLEKLKVELGRLEPAVKHLQRADENVSALVASFTNIHNEFAKHLESVERSLVKANEQHQIQISTEIQSSTRKITEAVDQFSKLASEFENQMKTFLLGYGGLVRETKRLIDKMSEVDFISRFDNLDAKIGVINYGFQGTQSRINNLEKSVNTILDAKSKELASKVEAIESVLTQKFQASENNIVRQFAGIASENKTTRILLLITIGLSIVALSVQFVKL